MLKEIEQERILTVEHRRSRWTRIDCRTPIRHDFSSKRLFMSVLQDRFPFPENNRQVANGRCQEKQSPGRQVVIQQILAALEKRYRSEMREVEELPVSKP
ncbi:MAG: hypothetical protein CM1200mP2_15030 [Planctomycetaceae bacterium]|nr:MAG: hypothetical protein CM1200mP2_15030 [Planctomycetaceae bacterium]